MSIPTFNTTLSTVSFYILLAVADRPLHGYGIRDQAALDSEGQVVIATGTLYPALKRLLASHLLEQLEAPEGQPAVSCRYRITAYGRTRLEDEARRLQRATVHATYKLGQSILR